MRRIISSIYNIVFTIIIILFLSYVITGATTGKPSMFGYRVFYVPTQSMEPVIMSHSFIVGEPVREDDLRVGDIATYYKKKYGKPICHRIVAKGEAGYSFKGDNNEEMDPETVFYDEIQYRIVWYPSMHKADN